jgi:ATP-dependent DNA ligase
MAEQRKRSKNYVGPKEMITVDRLPALESSGQWVAEEKHDGVWTLITVTDGKIVGLESRVSLPFPEGETAGLYKKQLVGDANGLLVGEMVADWVEGGHGVERSRSGTRRLHLFDIIEWNGLVFREYPLETRRQALEAVYETLDSGDLVKLVEQRLDGWNEWYEEIVARGGEGLVIKRKDSIYRAVNSDGKIDSWKRLKPMRTVDAVILGHGVAEKGGINLDIGLKRKGKVVRVQRCSLPVAWRSYDLESLKGQIVEIVGYEQFPSGAIRSGQIVRLRPDKNSPDTVPA